MPPTSASLSPLPPFSPDLYERAWCSVPHPTLPLLATAHGKSVTVFSLVTGTAHSRLTGGHQRSVRDVAWKPGLPAHKLCLVTGSFDSTAGLWRWDGDVPSAPQRLDHGNEQSSEALEVDVAATRRRRQRQRRSYGSGSGSDSDPDSAADTTATSNSNNADDQEWEFSLVLEGHDSEIKSVAFSPSGAHLATCSRDKSVWIWEDVGASEADDEWETVEVLNEHDGDVKRLAWCPDVPGRNNRRGRCYGVDVLASTSYDNTVRIWREDSSGEWTCVAVLEEHGETVWGAVWEADVRRERFPRLMTFSADGTIRVWTLQEDEDEDDNGPAGRQDGGTGSFGFGTGLGSLPNTMRRSLREDWVCTAVLPRAHKRDVYSVSWSAATGLVASTGADGVIAVYKEEVDEEDSSMSTTATGTALTGGGDGSNGTVMEVDGGGPAVNGHGHVNGAAPAKLPVSRQWRLLTKLAGAHGAYEVNHITWCKRFDPACARRGEEEMLVTSGDDGLIRPWQVVLTGG